MTEDQHRAQLWRKLTPNQRLFLMNETAPREQRVNLSHNVVAGRAIRRLGLEYQTPTARYKLTPAAHELAGWAKEHGYARHDNGTWVFSEPPPGRRRGRVDPDRLVQLAASGLYPAEIAKHLGVTREAVRQAAKREGLTLPRKPKKPAPSRQPRVLRPNRLAFCVSEDELAAIEQAATRQGVSVSAYLRQCCGAATEAVETA